MTSCIRAVEQLYVLLKLYVCSGLSQVLVIWSGRRANTHIVHLRAPGRYGAVMDVEERAYGEDIGSVA